jgi:predicted AAA+ superfamily ATPase
LDEIHYLIEKYAQKICFLISGSSARKLKIQGANLLAGRAATQKLFCFSYEELKNEQQFNLLQVLQFGALPVLWEKTDEIKIKLLKAYVDTYLREEILQEAIVRNIEAYSLFLDLAAQINGEPINYLKMAEIIEFIGPRAVGKTTLYKHIIPKLKGLQKIKHKAEFTPYIFKRNSLIKFHLKILYHPTQLKVTPCKLYIF